ncbi:DNA internalization-related competence protein ComEC/Rec2 [Candidatus Thioglobus sp.]|uniref:DNA internalization-related competence protein ComEC/Rec2 n=1 Tax=Candidatus Thioglobus sp. TaxID=2026721 RepID=UPI003D14F3E4
MFSIKSTLPLTTLEIGLIFALLLLVLALFKRQKIIALSLMFFVLGFGWMTLFSTHLLQENIDEKFFNKAINVIGTIDDLPKIKPNKTQFTFNVTEPFKAKIKLSWYAQPQANLHSGNEWKLLIKIKHNNGFQNEGGFDYERWLFYKKFDATGYVKRHESNQLITSNANLSINSIRQNIRQKLSSSLSKFEFLGVINALVIGDRSLINPNHWELFKATNTTHLSVISGLHIGLISGFVFLLSSFGWRQCARCTLRLPALIFGAYFGLLAALLYALIAGFSIPTQRAFIMASVVFLSIILRRKHNTWQLYGGALMLVLLLNPLSVLSAGFWLSFYVVAVIIYGARQHQDKHWILRLVYIQLLISIATLPLIAWFFSTGSSLSPIANLVAIPVFSFITTPFSLLGTILSYVQLQTLSEFVFLVANQSLVYLSMFLNYLQTFDFNQWHYAPHSATGFLLFIVAVLITLLPSALKLRKIALLLFVVIWLNPTEKLKPSEVVITTLDVGQGLSHVVRTQNHTLVFDTGARYRSGFNMGDGVILPYLQKQQINLLDLLIISHSDNDHIGGADSLLKNLKVNKIVSSTPHKISQPASLCSSLSSWQWDGVNFQMLNLGHSFTGNNASCVLKISNQNHSIILTGDIEKKAELHLIKTWGEKLKADVLISPHHGSKTSSSDQFLTTVSPELVIISSGYKNRFNHPATVVKNRYKQHKIKQLNTACSGQIDVKIANNITLMNYRKMQQRYYWRTCK